MKDWIYDHDDINIIVGIFPLRWELGFNHNKGLKRINIEVGPLALEVTYL